MAAKSAPKGGRTLGSSSEPNYARSAYQTVMNKENRSVVTAIGMFAVRLYHSLYLSAPPQSGIINGGGRDVVEDSG
jgi:hypothetical protein